jgi:hypothetical protein
MWSKHGMAQMLSQGDWKGGIPDKLQILILGVRISMESSVLGGTGMMKLYLNWIIFISSKSSWWCYNKMGSCIAKSHFPTYKNIWKISTF